MRNWSWDKELTQLYSSEVDTKCGVRPRELESVPLARLSPEHSPHSLPTLTQECNKETLFSKGWCALQEGGFELYLYYSRVGTELSVSCTQVWWLLALLKYPFYYMIRSGFGKFFGMIHVLTRHLAPELDRFRFCPGFWSIVVFWQEIGHFRRCFDAWTQLG